MFHLNCFVCIRSLHMNIYLVQFWIASYSFLPSFYSPSQNYNEVLAPEKNKINDESRVPTSSSGNQTLITGLAIFPPLQVSARTGTLFDFLFWKNLDFAWINIWRRKWMHCRKEEYFCHWIAAQLGGILFFGIFWWYWSPVKMIFCHCCQL